MKKSRIIAVLCLIIVLASGCTNKSPKTETYIIPNSYWEYAGTTAEDAVATFQKLGEEYYTDVKVVDEGVQVELTEQQRDNLIERNNKYNAQLIADFKAHDNNYRYEPDENYQKLELYFDEKIPPFLHVKTVYNLTAGYGMNYILKNNTTDWNVEICVYNCHTNKLVVSADAPYETVTCGPEEWKASYDE